MSRLLGAPPGYVGYDEGGQLTEDVYKRQNEKGAVDKVSKLREKIESTKNEIKTAQQIAKPRRTSAVGTGFWPAPAARRLRRRPAAASRAAAHGRRPLRMLSSINLGKSVP